METNPAEADSQSGKKSSKARLVLDLLLPLIAVVFGIFSVTLGFVGNYFLSRAASYTADELGVSGATLGFFGFVLSLIVLAQQIRKPGILRKVLAVGGLTLALIGWLGFPDLTNRL